MEATCILVSTSQKIVLFAVYSALLDIKHSLVIIPKDHVFNSNQMRCKLLKFN